MDELRKTVTNLPNHSLENVSDNQVALSDNDQESNVGPREERELFHVISLD